MLKNRKLTGSSFVFDPKSSGREFRDELKRYLTLSRPEGRKEGRKEGGQDGRKGKERRKVGKEEDG